MNFTCIRVEGGLIPADILTAVSAGEAPGQQARDFGLPQNRRLTDEIAAAWSDARAFWQALQRSLLRLPADDPATTPTREQWILPLLRTLGYEDITYMPRAAQIAGQTYAISHRAGSAEEAPPVHVVGFRADLDRRPPSGRPRLSPHALVQEYLNRSEHLWGIVTNGRVLRILRDSTRLTRLAYIEFDLEQMLAAEKFNDFALLYRLVHRTRLPRSLADAPQCLLEQYYQQGIEAGGRVREHLREGVEEALKILANGFLAHPANKDLRQRLQEGKLTPLEYYRQLLRLIYRLLFLMVAEERGLIGAWHDPEKSRIYNEFYSVSRLRKLAEGYSSGARRYCDLWLGLLTTFRLFAEEELARRLGMGVLDGDLFSAQAIPDLEGSHLANIDLLQAIRHLSLYREGRNLRRVNYAALDVEELGSVYESLLDYHPVVTVSPEGGLQIELLSGTERKSTGSYYTRPELVNELVKSTVDPVIADRLAKATTREEKEKALLSLKVVDPACGSGHFLLAAARRIGHALAQVRACEDQPGPAEVRRAVRDVITHCIYGVDFNPLAVELCKLALWLEGHVSGMPLTFLDHHIKCGNSLVGAMPGSMAAGIPDAAFDPVTGDDKETARTLKRRNRQERQEWEGRQIIFEEFIAATGEEFDQLAAAYNTLETLAEDDYHNVQRKAAIYQQIRSAGSKWWTENTAANLWTAAFFSAIRPGVPVPTFQTLQDYLQNPARISGQVVGHAWELAVRHRFFHWHLEFPQVFAAGGFDIVLGNPPWERIKLQEEEHWADDPYICRAPNKAERARRIAEYRRSNDPKLQARVAAFDRAKHDHEAISKFVRQSGRFPLTAVGDVNYYALFAELATKLLAPRGRGGMVLPTGIATDDTCKQFFNHLMENNLLAGLYDFENREALFPGVHRSYKFCLLTLAGPGIKNKEAPRFAFFLTRTEQLNDEQRVFALSAADLALLNPNTRTCPVFRTRADAELTRKIYRRVPVLVNERTGENPWGIKFATMFHMSNDSHLFKTSEELKSQGFSLRGNIFVRDSEVYLPLYEAKMIHQYDHRFGTYEGVMEDSASTHLPTPAPEQYADPGFTVLPRYWVEERQVLARTARVPAMIAAALASGDEEDAVEALAYWLAGYSASHGRKVELPASLGKGRPKFTVNELEARSMEEQYPLAEDDLQVIARAKSGLEAVVKLAHRRAPEWFLGFRNITNATNERSCIFSVIPRMGVGNSTPIMLLEQKNHSVIACLAANFSCLILDYVARQKIGGTNLNFFLVKQLPVLPPAAYTGEDLTFIVPRALELIYTALDLEPFARDVWRDADPALRRELIRRWEDCWQGKRSLNIDYNQPDFHLYPYRWNEERRARIRAELDAYYARLYGLTRDELRYILDPQDIYGPDFPGETFRVLKENETRRYGEYRTRRLVLEAWDRLVKK
ncbi:MAG: DNA methyltransferase [Moorella sp. (in: firmicutes)]